jgi:hypothetical protein
MRTKLLLLVALAACASAKETEAPAKPAQEVVPGAARLRGGGVRMDVEVGRTFTQRPIKGGNVIAKPAAPVVP